MANDSYRVVRTRTELASGGMGAQTNLTIPHEAIAGTRRFVTAMGFAVSSQAALAGPTEVIVTLWEGPAASGSIRVQMRAEFPAAIVAPYDRTLTDIAIEVETEADITLQMGVAVVGLNCDLLLQVEDRLYD